ncbi:DUF4124 domain-containing protein [Luteibacter aegosomatissinici]|uniref:DUF4124 domain-containing protein n=1 Tax=Luteibacter aegosomatissinici TaxID=2911539 RepID=UPI001FF930D4|nr:DUF4124 domain-containing protein [Luteibacter aegosomatissinici]UPG94910.1 DUF4124 domain-containing protein [Luteibacter aegosomatissinici]
MLLLITLLTLGLIASHAHAETVYKCTTAGQTIYQQTPCARSQHQEQLQLTDSAPADGRVAPMPKPPTDGVFVDETPPPQPPRPLPALYLCVRATDGKTYTSTNGHPDSYAAPLGVLGAVDNGLANTYGSRNAAVSSFPELNRGKGNAASVATSNYVWVQDQCRPMSPTETCQALRDQNDANQKAIRNAFKSERAPLDAKDAELRSQLQGCG